MSELRSQCSEILSRLHGIDNHLENVTTQVSTMKEALTITNQVLENQQQRMDKAEQRISTLEDTLQTTWQDLHRAEKFIKTLESETDDLENRGRRKNLVLLGAARKVRGQPNAAWIYSTEITHHSAFTRLVCRSLSKA